MSQPLSTETEPAIRAAARENKIHAIKLYREATGVGLAEAKTAVEKMAAESQGSSSLPTNAPAKGCFGMIAAGAVLVGFTVTSRSRLRSRGGRDHRIFQAVFRVTTAGGGGGRGNEKETGRSNLHQPWFRGIEHRRGSQNADSRSPPRMKDSGLIALSEFALPTLASMRRYPQSSKRRGLRSARRPLLPESPSRSISYSCSLS